MKTSEAIMPRFIAAGSLHVTRKSAIGISCRPRSEIYTKSVVREETKKHDRVQHAEHTIWPDRFSCC